MIGNINIPDEETGRTALHIAAKYGFSRCYRFLINQGALNHIKDKEGKTARDYLEQSISECLHLVDLIETNNKVKEKFIFKVGNSKQAPVIGGEVFEAFSTDFFFPEKCGLIKIEDHESFDGIEKKYEKKYKHQYIIKDQSLFYWNINLKNPKQQMLVNEKTWEAFKKELNLNKTRDANWSDLMIIAKYTNHLLETKNMQDCVYEALRINKIGYKETYCVMETQKIMPMTFPLYAEQTDKYIHFSVELDYQNIIEYLDMRFKSKMSYPSRTVLAIFLRSNFSEIETRVLKNTIINDKVTFKINNIDNPTEELFYFMFVEITDEHLRKEQQTNYAIGHYQLYACMPTIFNTLECTYMDVNSAMQNQLTQINKKINALAIPKIPIKSIISPSSEVLDEERIALLILEYAGISSDLIQAGSKNKGYHIPSDLKNTGWNYNGNSFMKTGFYLIEKQISKDAAPLDQNISKKMHETFSKYGNRFSYIIYDEGQTGEIKSHVFYFHETIFTEYLLPYLKDKYSKKSENSNIRSFNSTW